jgi:hypothetical protein
MFCFVFVGGEMLFTGRVFFFVRVFFAFVFFAFGSSLCDHGGEVSVHFIHRRFESLFLLVV